MPKKKISEEATFEEYPNLDAILKTKKRRLHAFRSGGGLRVIYLATAGKGACSSCGDAYGEHPHIEVALRLAELDSLKSKKYKDVYGKLVPHYFTGDSVPSSPLDQWILGGRDVDISFDKKKGIYTFSGEYWWQYMPPKGLSEKVVNAYKEYRASRILARSAKLRNNREVWREHVLQAREWMRKCVCVYEDDGVKYRMSPVVFANDEVGYTFSPVNKQHKTHGMRDWTFEGGDTLLKHITMLNVALDNFFNPKDKPRSIDDDWSNS